MMCGTAPSFSGRRKPEDDRDDDAAGRDQGDEGPCAERRDRRADPVEHRLVDEIEGLVEEEHADGGRRAQRGRRDPQADVGRGPLARATARLAGHLADDTARAVARIGARVRWRAPMTTDLPRRLLARLDDLGRVLADRGDALALLGLGSVGADLGRLDDHSDLDFFVIVDDGAKERYLAGIDWLEALGPIAFEFENTVDGRKVLFEDGIYAEYAVFTLRELKDAAFTAARVVWRRDDAPDGLEQPRRAPSPTSPSPVEWYVGEALTNLYVGLHRDLRGERLSGMRLIQVHAVDRLIELLDLLGRSSAARQDPFAAERAVERRLDASVLPLDVLAPGYDHNREAALAMLGVLEGLVPVDCADGAGDPRAGGLIRARAGTRRGRSTSEGSAARREGPSPSTAPARRSAVDGSRRRSCLATWPLTVLGQDQDRGVVGRPLEERVAAAGEPVRATRCRDRSRR